VQIPTIAHTCTMGDTALDEGSAFEDGRIVGGV